MSPQFNPTSTGAQDPVYPSESATDSETKIFASIDFAHLVGSRLLVYGWILGLAEQIDEAIIEIGHSTIDLAASCVRLRRPDVSRHFSRGPNDEHGFYTLIDLHHPVAEDDSLLLTVTSRSGESYESRWRLQRHTNALEFLPDPDLATLKSLLGSLPGLEATRLRRLLIESSHVTKLVDSPISPPPSIECEIDLCCVLEERVLIVCGTLSDSTHELNSVQLGFGSKVIDLLKMSMPFARLDSNPGSSIYRRIEPSQQPEFIVIQTLSGIQEAASEAIVALNTRNGKSFYLSRPLTWDIYESRSSLLSLLHKLHVQSGMELIEKLLSTTRGIRDLATLRSLLEVTHDRLAEQLPTSIQFTSKRLRHWLHIDHAIFIPQNGIFLSGWFHSEHSNFAQVAFHCGQTSSEVSKTWILHTRRDVTTFLEAAGIQPLDHEHGFNCYVAVLPQDHVCWISVTSESGEMRRLRIPAQDHQQSEMQTIRSLLSTFRCEQRGLRALLDRHVGPAVEAVWTKRKQSLSNHSVVRFGSVPTKPEVSIIVPLYGRWDFAEYQLAQFANDESFANVDLIYVVDDPPIYDNFRNAAAGLFGTYQIPFALAFSGTNLGFAGANNFAAQYAKGRFILLMNSDVLPKYPGWLTELVRTYQTLESPGLVGVKLIYEDGTLQHAGIEFRRHSAWDGLWINDHPFKGQMAEHLKGTREVDAVTAACALIDADLFRLLDGLSEDYIIGDFEDSDLCLRARRAGYKNYVALDVVLYHLERQSQNQTGDAVWRTNLTAYNCWLHNQRWSELIEDLQGLRVLPPPVFPEPADSSNTNVEAKHSLQRSDI